MICYSSLSQATSMKGLSSISSIFHLLQLANHFRRKSILNFIPSLLPDLLLSNRPTPTPDYPPPPPHTQEALGTLLPTL